MRNETDAAAVPLSSYRLTIFDFDGTLADTAQWFAGAINRVADRFGFRRTTSEELEMLRGMDNRAILQFLGVPVWKLPMIAVYARGLAAEDAESLSLFPGTRETLAELSRRGVHLGIVTSNAEETVRRVLGAETAGLIRYYECGASLFGKAAKFKRILKQSGVAPHEALAVGDEGRDIEAAKAAGIASGAATWGYAKPEILRASDPSWTFSNIADLLG